MKSKVVVVAALLTAAAAYLGGCVGQPSAGCPTLSPYWVRYTKVSATGTCGDLKGEQIGFQQYHLPDAGSNKVAYRPEGLGVPFEAGRRDPTDGGDKRINGFASIAALPADDHFCDLSDFVPAEASFEAVPGEDLADGGVGPVTPALHRRYQWTSLRILATANALGTVLVGDLQYQEDSCNAVFKADGIAIPLNQATGNLVVCNPATNAAKGYNIDCDPVLPTGPDGGLAPSQANGVNSNGDDCDLRTTTTDCTPKLITTGSGINPTFAVDGKPITCGSGGFCEPQLTANEISKL